MIKSIHVLVVVLFLALISFKVTLLLLNKTGLLKKVQVRTRVFDMIFGGLMVISGLYMAFTDNYFGQPWLLVKLVLVIASVPLAIVGLRRHTKWLSVLAVVLLAGVYVISETKLLATASEGQKTTRNEAKTATSHASEPEEEPQPKTPATSEPEPAAAVLPAEILTQLDDNTRSNAAQLYATLCARCHGLDGVPVFPGAPNLKELTCPKRAITGTIYSGRGQMPSFADVLTRAEISRLADYVQGMQENPE